MRKFILLTIATIFFIASATAQDTIIFKNADEVSAMVTAVTPDNISYKKWDNPDGPVYTIKKADVFYIKYQNGQKDVFDNVATTDNNVHVIDTKPTGQSQQPFNGLKFQSYIYGGAVFQEGIGGPAFDVSFGVRIYKYAYIGFETGFHCPMEVDSDPFSDTTDIYCMGYIPLGVNLKGYIPIRNKKIYPYINCSLGGFVGVLDLDGLNGFYCQVGAGIDIKRFSIGIGYSGLVKWGTANCGYVKLGVRLGKW